MCEETKRCFAPQTSNDAVDVGAMFDLALEQLEDLTTMVLVHAKMTIAASLIARGMYNPIETGGLAEVVNRILDELTEDPPPPPADPKEADNA